MSLGLADRVVVVTGGAGGLGRAEALAFAERGARVVVCDVRPPDATVDAIRDSGGEAVGVTADVSRPEEVASSVGRALEAYGDIHVLVNNAGIVRDGMCFNLAPADWDAVIAVNLTGTFLLAQACARHWRAAHKAGERAPRAIVNTTSESGLYGNAGQANYAAAKAGVAALTTTLAAELAAYGVRVNAVAPRARTSMSAAAFGELGRTDDFDPFAPEHVAAVVCWLASDAAAGMTGHVLVAHGGAVELLAPWRPCRRIQRDRPWTDADLEDLRAVLLDGVEPSNIPHPIRDLFVTAVEEA